MEQFAYSFAITLMHSVWQMALLLLLYQITVKLINNWPPLAKRNLLLLLLGAQLVCSVISFYIVYSEPFYDFRENVQQLLSSFMTTQAWLHSYAETIFWLYALMVLYKLGSALVQWINFSQHYKSDLTKPSIDLRLFTQTKAYHFGISRKVTIWYSKTIHSPMTFGFWKPVILLPMALVNQLTVEQTESLIIHELTHIKNNDYLLNWLLVVSESLYFFNPFVKIIAQKIKLEREKNCDVQVLQFKYPAISYAETLLYTAHQQKLAYSLQMSAVQNKQELLKRIQYFTQNNNFTDQQHKAISLCSIWHFYLHVTEFIFGRLFPAQQ
jgi:beta-lactamase regulating signal transducer with metallopeptidase domain